MDELKKRQDIARCVVAKILDHVDYHVATSEGVTFREWLFTKEGLLAFETQLADDVLLILDGG